MDILSAAQAEYDYMRALRQQLHACPAASWQERQATELIERECREAGAEVFRLGLPSGLVAVLRGRGGRPAALRADIDAVAGEQGPLHLCGHDYHSAALLGALRLLSAWPEGPAGDVWFVFQPAEEELTGAAELIAHGLGVLIPRDTPMFGLHNRPELPYGTVGVTLGPLMAAKKDFSVEFHGRTGHGGMPQLCIDPLPATAAFILGAQTIVSRNMDPTQPCVCAVCSVHGGSEANFAPETARLTGSIRALDQAAAATAARRVSELAQHTAAAYGCEVRTEFRLDVPVLDNPAALHALARRAAESIGADIASPSPILACEDFSVYSRLLPSFFYWVGSGIPGQPPPPWHSPDFAIDPRTLIMSCALYAASVLETQQA